MSGRSNTISKLRSDLNERVAYIRAKLGVLVPSQIKALRLKSGMPRQSDLAHAAQMHQSRISMFETPGAANLTIETLSRLAATFNTGLIIEFVPFSEMLSWENDFSQDAFDVVRLDQDRDFLQGSVRSTVRRKRKSRAVTLVDIAASVLSANLSSAVATSTQLNFFSGESAAGAAAIGAQKQAEGGQEIGPLNNLFSGGGIPDGRQRYNPAATETVQKRAVA